MFEIVDLVLLYQYYETNGKNEMTVLAFTAMISAAQK